MRRTLFLDEKSRSQPVVRTFELSGEATFAYGMALEVAEGVPDAYEGRSESSKLIRERMRRFLRVLF